MERLNAKGQYEIPASWLKTLQHMGIVSVRVDQSTVSSTIQQTWKAQKYLLDPHTSVGVAASKVVPALQQAKHVLCLATAHAAKFTTTVQQATGMSAQELNQLYLSSEYVSVANVARLIQQPPPPTQRHTRQWKQGSDWDKQLRDLIELVSAKRSLLNSKL